MHGDPAHAAFGMLEAIFGRIMRAARHRIAEHAPHRFAVVGMDAVEKAVDMRERGRIIGAPEFGHRAAPVDRARAGIIAPRRDSRKLERAERKSTRLNSSNYCASRMPSS